MAGLAGTDPAIFDLTGRCFTIKLQPHISKNWYTYKELHPDLFVRSESVYLLAYRCINLAWTVRVERTFSPNYVNTVLETAPVRPYNNLRVVGLEPTISDFGRRDSIHLNYTPGLWWLRSASTRRPLPLQGSALPTELHSHNGAGNGTRTRNTLIGNQRLYQLSYTCIIILESERLELSTFSLQSYCSPNWAMTPDLYILLLIIFDIVDLHVLYAFANRL